MSTIGTFEKTENGYKGEINTFTVQANLELVPVNSENDKAPDFRIMEGNMERGSAWIKTAKESRKEYVSLKLIDPFFQTGAIYSRLHEVDGEYRLIASD